MAEAKKPVTLEFEQKQQQPQHLRIRDGIRGNLLLGTAITVFLIGGVGAWAATTSIAGAVIAGGTVVVESSVKRVQHQSGGIVGEILVRDGDRVTADQVVIRLDETLTRANLQIISQQLDRAAIRKARLEAESIGQTEMRIPDLFKDRLTDPEIVTLIEGERMLLESRATVKAGQKKQLEARTGQLAQQIIGLNAQAQATNESLTLLSRDLATVQALFEKKLVSAERVSTLQLEVSRLRGESGRFIAAVAETEGRISEIRLQILQLDQDMRREVTTDLRDTEGKEVELMERKLVAQDQLARSTIRAPQAGIVQELAVHTVGGVVAPGETVMLIVPAADGLVVDARISPVSIDDVAPGQPVTIRFSAFDAGTTPECSGTVQRMSADLIKEPQSQVAYFIARVGLDDEKACLRGTRQLLPGMPAEVHIRTGDRNVLAYVFKPLNDQIARAFKE